ncbi:MAG: hypothetical protein KGJ09_04310 [Candidatus Omnitrophica bacterium]|nr:hypothetical protein [Candidatus Omnitrophota bacterium]MDE2213804.1 hypothetical protein [Candidatus Omnitrophota bacterium]MDE2230619.1 hypothetical protein [Candidatus Omnitrophota bacterium]
MTKFTSKFSKKHIRKCVLCGRPTFSPKSPHCRRCAHFTDCMNNRQIHKDAVKRIEGHVRRNGFVCEYTGKKLNLTDPKDPFYFSFDHMIPGDDKSVRLTFTLLNEMKSDMTFEEFKYYIRQFARFFDTGKEIIKRKLKFWVRLAPKIS